MLLQKNEMVLIRYGLTKKKFKTIKGPAVVPPVLWPADQTRIRLNYRMARAQVSQARTKENVNVLAEMEIGYRVQPDWITEKNSFNIPRWSEGLWENLIKRWSGYYWSKLVADYSWRNIDSMRGRIENQINSMLTESMKNLAIEILAVRIIYTILPDELQSSIIKDEKQKHQTQSRAENLRVYLDKLGIDASPTSDMVMQWEWMDMLRNKETLPRVLITTHKKRAGNALMPDADDMIPYQALLNAEPLNGTQHKN